MTEGAFTMEEMEVRIRRILKAIDEVVNPNLLEHKGWIELAGVDGDNVFVRFRGACAACNAMTETVDTVVTPLLRREVPEVKEVLITREVSDDVYEMALSLFRHAGA